MSNRYSTNELYHFGVKGMKWGVRKAREATSGGSKKRSLYDRVTGADKIYDKIMKDFDKRSSKSKSGKTNTNKTKKVSNNKDKTERMIKALELQQKAQTMSFIKSASTMALRSAGKDSAARFVNDFGNWQVSRMSAAAGYDFWR